MLMFFLDNILNCYEGFLKKNSLLSLLENNPTLQYQTSSAINAFLDDGVSHNIIIPAMTFKTDGILKKWTFAAKVNYVTSSTYNMPEFQVWRSDGNGSFYHKVHGISTEPSPTGYLNVYELVLPESSPVIVKEGDVFGMSISGGTATESRYSLAFVDDNARGYALMKYYWTFFQVYSHCVSASSGQCVRGYPLLSAELGS